MFTTETRIGVCGAGAMGAGIAQIAAQAGHDVMVLDRDEDALARGRASVKKGAGALLKRGKITEQEAGAMKGRIQWSLDVADMASCGLIIEAIVENRDIKISLFKSLEQATGNDTVLATNTSSLSVTSLAGGLARPARFLGLHFFNPAPIMKLVEVVSGAETDASIAEAAQTLMKDWGKVAVAVRDVPGFIVNRVARPYYGEGWRALEEGASDAATLDFLYKDLVGFRMGPFELGDLIGHDVNTAAAKSVFEAYFGRTRFTPSLAQSQLVEAGNFGRKSGRGVYDYGEGATAPAPVFLDDVGSEPDNIRVAPDADLIKALLDEASAKYSVDEGITNRAVMIGDTRIQFCDGRTAGALRDEYNGPAAAMDWMRDPAAASAIAFSACGQTSRTAAIALVLVCGKKPVELSDRPGLVVFRTLLQLANCAADAVRDQVADADSIDRAMLNGVNYPFGPMAWAAELGFSAVVGALDAIANETGEAMYRPSEALRVLARRAP